ncbi:MAG: hypothetical protein PVSMB2_36260 [Ktedonobacteraceae bacterium]
MKDGENTLVPSPPCAALDSPHAPNGPQTPPPSAHGLYVNIVDHAIHRLNDAARRIAAVEQSEKRQPRASRLAPFRDISADIQRQSTPLPKAVADTDDTPQKCSEVSASNIPDLWPWLPDTDDIDNNNTWENYTDPLLSRRFPDSIEAGRIDAEDERRARAEGLITTPFLRRSTRTTRLRIAFVSLAILAVLALTIDTALVSVAFLHPHHATQVPVSGPPTLTITSDTTKDNKASLGQHVFFHLMHFDPSTTVLITHDVGVPVKLSIGIPSVQIGRNGTATASTVITVDEWGPGFHTVNAEDVHSHYTANATLQIVGSGPSKPSHLIIKDLALDMGSGYQGANTIQPFVLSNDINANGAITWAASSNKPWLKLTPNQGTFSDTQKISIGVERGALIPGPYVGQISFSSNVGAPITVKVEMTVIPLPANVGAVLMITPVVLSFMSQDGASTINNNQVLVVSNPGHQTLSWSLANNQPAVAANQNPPLGTPGIATNWLNTSATSGVVPPGETETINVTVNSQNVLPGAYTDSLVFSSPDPKTINGSQSVSVSLTVQQHCSLTLSTGGMTFTAVSNSSNVSNQSLTVSASASCSSPVNWNATSSMSWLTITPASGSAKTGSNTVITVGVDAANMGPGPYVGMITIVSAQDGNAQGNTQTVTVGLTVQKPPPPNAPVLAASPLTMGFSTVQGQPVSSGQTVLITNSGQSVLQWNTAVSQLATSWLGVSPTGGRINPGQTATLTVLAVSTNLTPGTYNGQVVLNGSDTTGQTASGSPQTVAVQLQVNPPCALVQPSSSALAFTAIDGSSDPVPQSVTLSASGNCMWPLGWKASISPAASWLQLSSSSGSFGQGGLSSTLGINTMIANLSSGTYTAQVSISASDASGVIAQGSPQVFSITLIVQPQCQMAPVPASLAFTVVEGQVTPAQTFPVSETGTCMRPVNWNATGDASSANWLVVSPSSGLDAGRGARVSVSVNAASLPPGSYKTNLTVTASNGAMINNSTQTIPITVTVTGFTVSGTVEICAESTCTKPLPIPLPSASVVLTNAAAGTQVATTTADANGNYTFPNVASGTYTVSASGTSSTLHYVGSIPLVVTGNMSGNNIPLLQG